MLIPLLLIAAGIVLLYAGAEGLVRGSAAIARRLGLTPLVIGLTVVAFGTSMPEMVVSVGAALAERAPIAAGNVVGSNVANIALILGTCALIRPLSVHSQLVRRDVPVLIAVTLLLVFLLQNDLLSRLEGSLLVAGLAGYTLWSLHLARSEANAVQEEFAEAVPSGARSVVWDVGFVLGGLVLLVVGARLLISGAVTVAEGLGISDAVIGLTVVAVGTSLPELATSILAAFRKEGDIAIGNVVGSNLFNILGILGVASLVRPLRALQLSWVDLGVMVGLTLVLLPLAWSGFRIARWEGALLLAVYVAYVAFLIV